MSEVKLTKELQEIFNRTERENKIGDIIRSNDVLSNALSSVYYLNKFKDDLSNIGIDINNTDFGKGIYWLTELIKEELMYEFEMPKEVFEAGEYLNIIYGLHLTDGALIVSLSQYINWIQENATTKAD